MENVQKRRQFLAGIISNLASFAAGLTFAWTSPSIPRLREPDLSINPIGRIPTAQEVSLIAALLPLGALISPFVAGPLTKRIGRKWTLMSSAAFFITSFVMLGLGKNVNIIYVARLFQGFGTGITNTACAMYVGEIASVSYRGALGSLMQLFLSLGILFVYSIGPFVSYVALQFICLTIPVIFVVTFFFMPESPNYLLSKEHLREDAMLTLQYLRVNSFHKIEAELAAIDLEKENNANKPVSIKELFVHKGNRRAITIAAGLLFAQQACGIDVVLFNSQTIFELAGTNMKPEYATIIIGIVQIVASMSTVLVVERMGRKLLVLISTAIMCVTLGTLGLYFFLEAQQSPILSSIKWLPVASLVVFIIGYNIGIGPVPWAILGEIFPCNVKSYAATISTSVCWTTSFILIVSFESINEFLGVYWSFWIFSIFCVGGYIFTHFMVFETKGLSFEEIQNKLKKRS